MIDEVLSGTAKGDGVLSGMDNGKEVGGLEQPLMQQKEAAQEVEVTQQVEEEE